MLGWINLLWAADSARSPLCSRSATSRAALRSCSIVFLPRLLSPDHSAPLHPIFGSIRSAHMLCLPLWTILGSKSLEAELGACPIPKCTARDWHRWYINGHVSENLCVLWDLLVELANELSKFNRSSNALSVSISFKASQLALTRWTCSQTAPALRLLRSSF